MKKRNQRIWSKDTLFLKRLEEEFIFIGRKTKLDTKKGLLVVFALPQKREKSKREKQPRNKRAESAGRRER